MSPEKFKIKLDLRTKMNMVSFKPLHWKYKAGQVGNKSTDRLGYKQEARFTSTEKYVDKELGFTTEYQSQVNSRSLFIQPSLDLHYLTQLQQQQESQLRLGIGEIIDCC